MLHEFLTANRQILIARCREKVAKRFKPAESAATVDHGVPLFLQQLVDTLRSEQQTHVRAGADSEPTPAPTPIGRATALHGAELLRRGFTVDQVVHDYGGQRLADYGGEQKRLIDIAEKLLSAIQTGSMGITGATGSLLSQTLEQMRSLNDRTLPKILLASPSAGPSV